MPDKVLFGIIAFLAVIVIAFATAVTKRSYGARVLCAISLLLPLALCVFGFAHTFEPLDATTQWTWRGIYGVVGLLLVATIGRLLRRRKKS